MVADGEPAAEAWPQGSSILGQSLTGCNGWCAIWQGDLSQCGRISMHLHGYLFDIGGVGQYPGYNDSSNFMMI